MQLSVISQELFIKDLIEQLNIPMDIKYFNSFSDLQKLDIFNSDIVISDQNINETGLFYLITIGQKQFDYPIKTHELLKLLNHFITLMQTSIFKLNDEIKLNSNDKTIKLKSTSELITLLPKEAMLLKFFAENRKPISKEFLLENIWDITNPEVSTATVETHIYRLRKKHLALNNLIKHDGANYHI